MLAVLLPTLVFGFTTCGDDNYKPEVHEVWTTSYVVNVAFGQEMFEVVDITAYIAHPDGIVTEEAVLQKLLSEK